MAGWSEAEVEIKLEMEEEFCATLESIKSEEERNDDIEPATLPEKHGVQRIGASSQYSEVARQSNNDVSLPSRCRLCAIPYGNMVDVFSSPKMEDILEKIQYSLHIMVTETDTLPKQICRFCLKELERCYRFHKTVAEAEKKLHAFHKLASMKSRVTKRNDEFFPLCDEQRGPTEYNYIDGSLKTTTIPEEAQTSHTTVKGNVPTTSWRPCAVWLPDTDTCCENNSDAENNRKSSSDTEDGNPSSTKEVFHSGRAIAPEMDEQSSCDSEVHIENPDDFALAHSRKQLHKCNICAKTFKWKYKLTEHSLVHTDKGLELYKCDTCAKMFKWKYNLIKHCKTLHMDKGLEHFKCNTCAKTFQWKHNLLVHNKIHTNEGLHSCEYCGKKFVTIAHRDRHHRIHTNERPFKCLVCVKSFNRKSDLKRHAGVHSDERNYPCSECDKCFKSSLGRRYHMAVHQSSQL